MARSGSRLALAALPLALAFAAAAEQPTKPAGPQSSVTVNTRDRVVITGMVPIPDVGEGAPRFSSKDVDVLEKSLRDTKADVESEYRFCNKKAPFILPPPCDEAGPISRNNLMSCEAEHARKAANLADRAAEITRASEDVRRAAMGGEATPAQVEEAELKRQAAVNAVQKERAKLLEWQANAAAYQKLASMGRKTIEYIDIAPYIDIREKADWGLGLAQPDTPKGLSITGVTAVQRTDKKGDYVLIQGKIYNKLGRSVSVPPLQASLVDDRGWPLYVTSVEADGWQRKIPGGKSYDFGFIVRPAPDAMTNAIVAFAMKDNPPPRMHMRAICNGGIAAPTYQGTR